MSSPYLEKVQALNEALELAFQEGMDMTPTRWNHIATEVLSKTTETPYRYLGQGLSPSKENTSQSPSSEYALANEDFYSNLSIPTNDLDDEQVGVYGPAIREMGSAAARFVDEKVFRLLSLGTTQACHDGQPFFSAAHPLGQATVGNLKETKGNLNHWYLLDASRALRPLIFQKRKAASLECYEVMDEAALASGRSVRYGTHLRAAFGYGSWQLAFASSETLSETTLEAAITQMQGQKDAKGQVLGVYPTHLIVPPALRSEAMGLVGVDRKADGKINPYYQALSLVVSPWVAHA